jgi:2-dehydropantoate 2-reductase
MMADAHKKSVLLIGGGAVGAVAALNLQLGGLADVTIVLRSNFDAVDENGFDFVSCDHGSVTGFRPSVGAFFRSHATVLDSKLTTLKVRNTIPDINKESLPPYDYILLSTKNVPDVPPTAVDLVSPALPQNNTHTTLILLQNGLNIEKPFLTSYPTTPVLSGVSLIGSAELTPGQIVQDDPDRLFIGAFPNPSLPSSLLESRAQEFVSMYSASGKTHCTYSPNVLHDRWKKLVYNACLNPICAITGLDTGRIRLADGAVDGLVKPAMREIVEAARVCAGVRLVEGVVQDTVDMDPLESYLKPSMQQDLEKVCLELFLPMTSRGNKDEGLGLIVCNAD